MPCWARTSLRRDLPEIRMRREEAGDDGFILLGQDAAGGVHQTPARLHQARGALENVVLLAGELRHALRRLPPLQVGVAPQRAEAAAGGVDQHAVELAGEALDADVVLVGDRHRVHVGESRPCHAGLQPRQPPVGNIEGIEPAGRAHQGAEQQRLAAGAGAEIRRHLAAPGRQQVAEQLAALVLHLDAAVDIQRMLLQRRLGLQADAQRRQPSRLGGDALPAEACQHRLAPGLERVDAQVERRGLVESLRQRQQLGRRHLRQQALGQPVGHVRLLGGAEIPRLPALQLGHPLQFLLADGTFELPLADARQARQRRQHQAARIRLLAEQVLQQAPAPQHGIGGLGDEAALALAKQFVVAEECRQHGIGRMLELQQQVERGCRRVDEFRRNAHADFLC